MALPKTSIKIEKPDRKPDFVRALKRTNASFQRLSEDKDLRLFFAASHHKFIQVKNTFL